MELQGIDVSHYQGNIDWSKVKADGKYFAIMKCQYEAQSHRIDETFEYNYSQSGLNGLARGVYIYIARASMADPEGDAKALLEKLKGRPLEYGIWLDLEDKSLQAKGKGYIKSLVFKYADIFMEAGYYVGIYCNRSWYINLIHQDLKDVFDFWIARYPSKDLGLYNTNSSLKPSKQIAVAWQYSSKGKVAGISGNVDLDVDYDGNLQLYTNGKLISSNPYTEPSILIKQGSTGDGVKWVQYELNQRGYGLVVDGIAGTKTIAAIKNYQLKSGLIVDGICGVVTRNALKIGG